MATEQRKSKKGRGRSSGRDKHSHSRMDRKPILLIPNDQVVDPFQEVEDMIAAKHASGDIDDAKKSAMLRGLNQQRKERRQKLLVCARFIREIFGITRGFGPEHLQVVSGTITDDGKRAVLSHGDPARRRVIQTHGQALRATEAYDPGEQFETDLAVWCYENTEKGGTGQVKTLQPYFVPLHIIEEVLAGHFHMDVIVNGVTFRTPTREGFNRMHQMETCNAVFSLNTRSNDPLRKYVANHPVFGRPIFAPFIPDEFQKKQGQAGQKVGVSLVPRLGIFEAQYMGGLVPDLPSDEDWTKRQALLQKEEGLRIHRELAARAEVGDFIDSNVLYSSLAVLGLGEDDEITTELLDGMVENYKADKVPGTRAALRRAIRSALTAKDAINPMTVEDANTFVDDNHARLFALAIAAARDLVPDDSTDEEEESSTPIDPAAFDELLKLGTDDGDEGQKPPAAGERTPPPAT